MIGIRSGEACPVSGAHADDRLSQVYTIFCQVQCHPARTGLRTLLPRVDPVPTSLRTVSKFLLDFLDRGETGFELVRKRLGDLVAGDTDGR